MRLIDADELRSSLTKLIEKESSRDGFVSEIGFGVKLSTSILDRMKTIEPVKHGHWIKKGFGYKCSECGAIDNEAYFFRKECGKIQYSEYCRVCGTHMDDEVIE